MVAGKLQRHANGKLVRLANGKLGRTGPGGTCCCDCFTSLDGCIQSRDASVAVNYVGDMWVRKSAETPKFQCTAGDNAWDDAIVLAKAGHSDADGLRFREEGTTCTRESVKPTGDDSQEDGQSICQCDPVTTTFGTLTPARWQTILTTNPTVDSGTPAHTQYASILGTCTSFVELVMSTISYVGQWEVDPDDTANYPDDWSRPITLYLATTLPDCIEAPNTMHLILE